MAYEANLTTLSFIGSGDLSSSQFKAVKLSADNTVVICDGATDKPIGVLQNKPKDGQTAVVAVAGVTKWQGDADLTAGDLVGTSADGQADAKTPGADVTEYVIGTVLMGNSAAAGLASVLINSAAPHRAA